MSCHVVESRMECGAAGSGEGRCAPCRNRWELQTTVERRRIEPVVLDCFQQCVLVKLLSPLRLNYERLFLCHYISHLPQMCFIFHLWLDNLSVQIVTYIRRVDSGILPYSPLFILLVDQVALEQVAVGVSSGFP